MILTLDWPVMGPQPVCNQLAIDPQSVCINLQSVRKVALES